MKIVHVCIAIVISYSVYAQEVDSAFLARVYHTRLTKDSGQVLPYLTFVDEQGQAKTLSDYKGKIVVIDIWSTDCYPCLSAFPYQHQLQKRLEAVGIDTMITFLNICTDSKKADWKRKVKKYNPAGILLFAKDTLLSSLWDIKKFPTYILMDRDGKILSADMMGPSESGIDYILYAATKDIQPYEALVFDFKQYSYYRTHKTYTDDPEGKEYAMWNAKYKPAIIKYIQWRDARKK